MTAQEILDDINLRLPNKFAVNDKIRWMNNCVKKYWQYLASTELYTFNTTDDQAFYEYADNMVPEKIQKLEVASSAGSTSFMEYDYAGINDDLSGGKWLNTPTSDGMMLQLYPAPSTTVEVKIRYETIPTEVSNSSDTVDIPDEYADLIKFNVMKVIAQSGNAPDVDLSNNYDMEERDEFRRLRMDYYKKKQRLPRQTKTYKDHFWNGWGR